MLLVLFSPGIELVNMLSSMVYAYGMPFKAIAMTLLYYRLTGRRDESRPAFARKDQGTAEVETSLPIAAGATN